MVVRSILLHLDAGPGSIGRLTLAHALADRFGAEVTVLFGGWHDAAQPDFAYSAGAALRAAPESEETHEVERALMHAAHQERRSASLWCDVGGDLVQAFVGEAAYADLLVVGVPASVLASAGASTGFVEATLLRGGTPTLVVPSPLRQETLGERVLIAWDGSVAASRAVRASLPLIRDAARVDVATWSPRPVIAPISRLSLRSWLRRHGIEPEMHEHPETASVGKALSAMSTSLRSDLIVMGCYGHSPLRERVFGGATRSLLAALPAPVLMAH